MNGEAFCTFQLLFLLYLDTPNVTEKKGCVCFDNEFRVG